MGRKGSRWVIELLDKGAIGAESAACHVTRLAVGGGVEVTERRAVQEILVVGFTILLMR